jgi:exodeoxyribonuclease (lambda-induced)
MEQRTKDWFDARKGCFTASQISRILGKSLETKEAQSYITEKLAEVLNIELPSSVTQAMEWGTKYEEWAFKWVNKAYFTMPFEKAGFLKHENYSFLGGSPDGLSKNAVLEIKCPFSSLEHLKYKLNIKDNETLKKVNSDYYYQLQCNMLIAKKPKGVFASFDPRLQKEIALHIVEIEQDVDAMKLIEERACEAYEILKEMYFEIL